MAQADEREHALGKMRAAEGHHEHLVDKLTLAQRKIAELERQRDLSAAQATHLAGKAADLAEEKIWEGFIEKDRAYHFQTRRGKRKGRSTVWLRQRSFLRKSEES